MKPGDGSAREQAASCQKVLGGWANIANEYATKRYRSNLINWGMLPFLIKEGELPFTNGDYLFFPQIRKAVEEKDDVIRGYVVGTEGLKEFDASGSLQPALSQNHLRALLRKSWNRTRCCRLQPAGTAHGFHP